MSDVLDRRVETPVEAPSPWSIQSPQNQSEPTTDTNNASVKRQHSHLSASSVQLDIDEKMVERTKTLSSTYSSLNVSTFSSSLSHLSSQLHCAFSTIHTIICISYSPFIIHRSSFCVVVPSLPPAHFLTFWFYSFFVCMLVLFLWCFVITHRLFLLHSIFTLPGSISTKAVVFNENRHAGV